MDIELDTACRKIGFIALAIVLFCLLGIVGHLEHEDAVKEEAFYCEMVQKGYWPDYKELNCR